jgi:hypothetical protein
LVALLVFPALTSTASAFSTDGDTVSSTTRPVAAWCYVYIGGRLYVVPC